MSKVMSMQTLKRVSRGLFLKTVRFQKLYLATGRSRCGLTLTWH